MKADGTSQHQVIAMAPYAADVGGISWSPDGKQLVYGVFNTGSGQPTGGRAFFIVNVDGSGNHQLTDWKVGADGTPDWSASTNQMVFRIAPDAESGVGNFFTMSSDGSRLAQATHLKKSVVSRKVSFSADG
jgi:Tol biopolymer transport system component